MAKDLLNVEELLKELTIEEKAALLSGTDFMYTNSVPRLGIPSLCMADGPHGLRKQIGEMDNGISQSEPATAFPTAVTTASSWNTENSKKMGEAIAEECKLYGVNILLGPGVNIKRNPLCGRNFEYFSEDPIISGAFGSAFVSGVQSKDVAVSVKHFAANNSENFRFMGESVVDDRALREIYLKAFETVVKNSNPYTVMCAYNKIHGIYCSENKWLLTDVLRNEWGFSGAVMTDWGATHNRVAGVKAGLELEMPGDTTVCRANIIESAKNGSLSINDLDTAVERVLNLINRCYFADNAKSFDKEAHHNLAIEIACDSAVLLKNDNNILPLDSKEKICVVGELFEKMRYQGAGSSMINPTMVDSPKIAFDKFGVNYVYSKGYTENTTETDEQLLVNAILSTKGFDKVVVFAGLTDYVESEGCDRINMQLPQNQIDLVERLINAKKQVVLVMYGGSPVEMPFINSVAGVLNMYLPGQGGGEASRKLLFGEVCPSGKLAETWVKSYADVPFGSEFSQNKIELYKESIFVGYRYYDTANVPVRFPFGYGLSYTSFVYSNFDVQVDDKHIKAKCTITNTGKVDGAEVVQIYLKNNTDGIFKANKELKGFSKVYLKAGESKDVEITVDKSELAYYNTELGSWVTENGSYGVEIASSVQEVHYRYTFEVSGEKAVLYNTELNAHYKNATLDKIDNAIFEKLVGYELPKLNAVKPITLESRFLDLKSTFMGKILYNGIMSIPNKQLKQAKKLPEGIEKDNRIKGAIFMRRIMDSNSILSSSMAGGKAFPYNFAEGMVLLANGRIFKGVAKMTKKIDVPKLPKEMQAEEK